MNLYALLLLITLNIKQILSNTIPYVNSTFYDEISKPTSSEFADCEYNLMATEWSCFSDASKIWQYEEIRMRAPNNDRECCAVRHAFECITSKLLVEDHCDNDGKRDYQTYLNERIDKFKENGCKIDSVMCSSALHLFTNNLLFAVCLSLFIIRSVVKNF